MNTTVLVAVVLTILAMLLVAVFLRRINRTTERDDSSASTFGTDWEEVDRVQKLRNRLEDAESLTEVLAKRATETGLFSTAEEKCTFFARASLQNPPPAGLVGWSLTVDELYALNPAEFVRTLLKYYAVGDVDEIFPRAANTIASMLSERAGAHQFRSDS